VLAVAGAFMVLAALGRAQGAYADDNYDGIYFYGDVVGYSNSTGCGGSGTSFWSSLSQYLSGTVYYPNQVTLPDSIYANPGDYNWGWGFWFQFPDPYGDCASFSASFTWPIHVGRSTTYYTTPQFNYPDANGYCYYWQDACINGSVATIDETVLNSDFSYHYNAGVCTSLCPRPCPEYVYQNYGYAVVNGGSPIWVRFNSGQGGPGSCN
jgi:hypothetical protein